MTFLFFPISNFYTFTFGKQKISEPTFFSDRLIDFKCFKAYHLYSEVHKELKTNFESIRSCRPLEWTHI